MIGQLLDGRYRIIQVLSSATFGQTYLAADTRLPGYPQCVVKQIRPPSANPRIIQIIKLILQKKAESLEKLGRNDHVPQLLAYFEVNQEFYLVEEFIAGHPLTQEILPKQPLSEERVIRLLQEILEILVFVHGNGAIHLDIKPGNFIRRQLDGKLVLIDFGPIKEISSQLLNGQERVDRVRGSNASIYMPIEQIQGHSLFNSDIYAVGMIAIQAITGLSPEEIAAMRDKQNSHTNKFVWQENTAVNPALANLLDKMVHPDFADRYQSAADVLADLKTIKNAISMPPPPSKLPSSTHNTQLPVLAKDINIVKKKFTWPHLSISSPIIVGLISIMVVGIGVIFWPRQGLINGKDVYNRGMEKITKGDTRGAIAEFNQVIQANPNDPIAYGQRGNAHYDLGEYKQAIEDYTQTIRLDSTNTSAYFNRGLARYDQKDLRGAIDDYTQVIRLKPTQSDAYYKRGLAYYDLQEYQAAIADFTEFIRIKPNDHTGYHSRGLARSGSGDKPGAIEDFTKAIQINSKEPDAYYSRGRARFLLADYNGALEDYSQVIKLNPKDADALANRCGTLVNLKDYKKAVEDCNQAIKLESKTSIAYDNRCIAYFNLGDHTKAIEDCTQAIKINPNNSKTYSNRGLSRSAIGDRTGSISDFSQAIRLNPSDAVAYTNRGNVQYQLKEYAKAIEDFTQALRLNPKSFDAYSSRAKCRLELGDKQGAIEDFQKSSNLCLDAGLTGCYQDAQTQIKKIQQP